MIYTDAEIYYKIRQGVDRTILAQLNGCSRQDIDAAYLRHKAKVQKDDSDYKQGQVKRKFMEDQLEKQLLCPAKVVASRKSAAKSKSARKVAKHKPTIEVDNPSRKPNTRVRFKYTEQIVSNIANQLKKGSTVKIIYAEVFSSLPEEERPTYKTFQKVCTRIKAGTFTFK